MGDELSSQQDLIDVPTLRHLTQPRDSPFQESNYHGGGFVSEEDRVLIHTVFRVDQAGAPPTKSGHGFDRSPSFTVRPDSEAQHSQVDESVGKYALRCGPRRTIFWNPQDVTAAIVTVGTICPGINDVLMALVTKLIDYGVPSDQILGIRYGFKGFNDREHKPIKLTRELVQDWHLDGGTGLGTGRERADIFEIVKKLDLWKVDHLYVIGGHGGIAAAEKIYQACSEHDVPTSVVALPKTIDNDMVLLDKCFGFETAIEEAQSALLAAKVEASSGYRGIGIVKLAGKRAGFITVQASMASGLVDICLIPEVPFNLEGEKGVYAYVDRVLERQGHCVICIAEGAGRGRPDVKVSPSNPGGDGERDDEGLEETEDIGPWLKGKLKKAIKDADIKYIDPSYMIRSIPATSQDRIYCRMLAHGAVHGAFAGYTGIVVGMINSQYCYIPSRVMGGARIVDPRGELWARLRSAIGQPNFA